MKDMRITEDHYREASEEEFTRIVDNFLSLPPIPPDLIPPPGFTGFTIKKLSSHQEGHLSLSGVFSSQFHTSVKQHPNGDLHIGDIKVDDTVGVLDFLEYLKKQQPQIEIVFTTEPKSPGVFELAREGIRTILHKLHIKPID